LVSVTINIFEYIRLIETFAIFRWTGYIRQFYFIEL
jgi:hypothetical protein